MKTVPELKFCSGTTAWALLYQGKYAGKVIANWSDNPAGATCSASVVIWDGPLEPNEQLSYSNVGRSQGYGYDKLDSSIRKCLFAAGVDIPTDIESRSWLEKQGYYICEVL